MHRIFLNIRNRITQSAHNQWILVVIILFLISCDNASDSQHQAKKFYDLKGFIEGQIVKLDSEKPVVLKVMEIGADRNQLSTKNIDWKKELELFSQADINKPAYSQSYSVIRSDSLNFEYVMKQGENLPVRYLKIQLNEAGGVPVKIEALLKSENKLYRSEKKIHLRCLVKGNSTQLVSYDISGFQKLAIMQEKPFSIQAEVQR